MDEMGGLSDSSAQLQFILRTKYLEVSEKESTCPETSADVGGSYTLCAKIFILSV